jgi:cytochrome P450
MSLATTNSKSVPLNLLQQWRYLNEPQTMGMWIREHYGDFVPVHFQGKQYLAVVTPEGARQVFTADPNGYEVFWKESFAGLMGDESVWVLIGERHRRERLLFSPAVHANHFRSYGGMIQEIVRSHTRQWTPGQTFRAIETTLAISLDIIMRLVFGVEEDIPMDRGRKVLSDSTEAIHPLIVFFPSLQKNWFPLWRKYDKARSIMYQWTDELMEERRLRGSRAGDVLSVLMNARDENGTPVSRDYIHTELNSVLSAGHETTATALAWALYELSLHPDVLAKLRAELENLEGGLNPEKLLIAPYLGAVVYETIRLHPILAECARIPMQPMEILGRRIEAGQSLVVSIVNIHHDPLLYPEPNTFRPERFLERNYNIFEFLPFGGGHRRCMGAGLAEYSLRIALAEMAMNWDLESVRKDRDIRRNIAMGPKYGVRLRVKPRQ